MHNIGNMFGNPADTRSLESDEALVDSTVLLGIELELEGVQHLRYQQSFLQANGWNWITDHSLRGTSCELITQADDGGPIRGMDVVTALEALTQAVENARKIFGTTPDTTERTSTHIHVDVRDMLPEQVSRFVLLYVMLENILLKSEAPERCNNNYCLPVSRSHDLKSRLSDLIGSEFDHETVRDMVSSWPKYSALNVGAAANLGTLEFRIFPGSFDSKQILRWVNMVLSLRRAAVSGSIKVDEIPTMVSGQGVDAVFHKIFPKDIADYLLTSVDYRDLLDGARIIQGMGTDQYSRRPLFNRHKPQNMLSDRVQDFKDKRAS